MMAVGVVGASSKAVFQTVMSLGPSRSEWDYCFSGGSVIEYLDDHTDIIHMQLNSTWLPWGMKKRDFLLRRCWKKQDNGTYVILYHSVSHPKCQPESGYIRAFVKYGGFVISPVHQGKQSVVKHILAVDWKCWNSCLIASCRRSVTAKKLHTVAALRELFKAKQGMPSSDHMEQEIDLPHMEEEQIKVDVHTSKATGETTYLGRSLIELSDADEFFNVPDFSFCSDDFEYGENNEDLCHLNLSATASFEKTLKELAAQNEDDTNSVADEAVLEETRKACTFDSTLPEDTSCNLSCSWATSDPSTYMVRGETYLHDQKKVPGLVTHNLVLYYMLDTPLKSFPLLESFVEGDDTYRNSRFKLIPQISKGPWIVKQSVGKKPCILGQALDIRYFRGKNYLELAVDVGSSVVAKKVVNLVLGYLNNLVIEMAFLIQSNTPEELPEFLLGTCRLNHLDASKSVAIER